MNIVNLTFDGTSPERTQEISLRICKAINMDTETGVYCYYVSEVGGATGKLLLELRNPSGGK